MATVVPLERRIDLVDGYPWTDSGNAERLITLAGADLRYVRSWHKWLGWNGKCWAIDDGAPHRGAKSVARAFMTAAQRVKDPDARGRAIRYALKCESKGSIEAMVALARHELAIAIDHEQLDADPWLLCVRNGTVDLRTGALREHRREDLVTKLAPIDYDPAATCERFERFVSEIMGGDDSLVTFLRRFLGYCLTGDVREHILAFWHGAGGNGKSLLALVILFVLGDYAGKAAPDLLFRSEKTERHPAEIADLHGLRLVFCNETSQGRAWDEARVKDVTGGDRIKARRMREDFWSFDPTHKLVVFGNHRPTIRCVDSAIERRLRLVPFAVSFIGREDKDLAQALKAEGAGVLAWLVHGCLEWQAEGLPDVAAVRDATRAYLRDEDSVGQFLDRECIFAADARCTRKELRERYTAWAEERDERPVGPKVLAEAVRRRGALERQVRNADGKPRDGWAGVRLATEAERAAAAATSRDVASSSEQFPVRRDETLSHEVMPDQGTTPHYSPTDDQESFAEYLDREEGGR